MSRQINELGLALARAAEGLRLTAYEDTGGVWTVGYGHTAGVMRGDTCTKEKAEDVLRHDLREAGEYVSKLVKVALNDNQFAALSVFVLNIGPGAFERSSLLRKLNTGNYSSVPPCLKAWVFDNGRVLQGLVKRRAAEAELWGRA